MRRSDVDSSVDEAFDPLEAMRALLDHAREHG